MSVWIHDSFFQCIIMHSHHYLFSVQTVLYLAKAILPSLLAKASLLAQVVKNLPEVQKTWVWSLDREDLLEKGMAAHSSILAWRIPWTDHGVVKSCTSRVTHTFTFTFILQSGPSPHLSLSPFLFSGTTVFSWLISFFLDLSPRNSHFCKYCSSYQWVIMFRSQDLRARCAHCSCSVITSLGSTLLFGTAKLEKYFFKSLSLSDTFLSNPAFHGSSLPSPALCLCFPASIHVLHQHVYPSAQAYNTYVTVSQSLHQYYCQQQTYYRKFKVCFYLWDTFTTNITLMRYITYLALPAVLFRKNVVEFECKFPRLLGTN